MRVVAPWMHGSNAASKRCACTCCCTSSRQFERNEVLTSTHLLLGTGGGRPGCVESMHRISSGDWDVPA